MAKAELGTKRRCLNCATSFFDLDRTPILCPKCGAAFQIVEYARSRPRWTPSLPNAAKKSGASDQVESEAEPALLDAEHDDAASPSDEDADENADREIDEEESEQDGAAED
ncbi:MAG TPA: TIGR02300 family protein [Methylosinus sp.]|uniref:TIGR02300 family protein n=1 Tax=Methylosinus sp. TaxID=427 RepID=UPI002F9566A4